jgi:zinc transporter 1/2/3
MFNNECVGELGYEATTTAIAMAGLFVAAVVEYAGHRFIEHRSDRVIEQSAESGSSSVASKIPLPPLATISCHTGTSEDKLSVFVMEMGIIFHSILIGITLVVAGDSVFTTLLIVIIFHQGFEGLALGARISNLAPTEALDFTKLLLASMFSLITPIGMAIGIGVRDRFNGNDRETLIALGTLDALSAGILVWVGVVEMAAGDWLWGELRRAGIARTLVAGTSLVAGMVLMGLLGKWA